MPVTSFVPTMCGIQCRLGRGKVKGEKGENLCLQYSNKLGLGASSQDQKLSAAIYRTLTCSLAPGFY